MLTFKSYENNELSGIFLSKSFLRRSLRGPFVKGRFHNRSSAEPIKRGAFVKGSFVQGGGGVYNSDDERIIVSLKISNPDTLG